MGSARVVDALQQTLNTKLGWPNHNWPIKTFLIMYNFVSYFDIKLQEYVNGFSKFIC